MIETFGNRETENFYITGKISKNVSWQSVKNIAMRKLDMIAYAKTITDLKSPPANRLEKLKGDLSEYHSIRINDQFRIIFRWEDSQAYDVKIVDYHR